MTLVKGLLGVIGVLLGGFLFQRSKNKSAEALLTNADTKDSLRKTEAVKDVNNAHLQVEEEKRKEAHEQAEKEKAKPIIDSDLLDFLNRNGKE